MRRSRRAFSLIEMMVAMSLLGILVVALTQLLLQSLKSQQSNAVTAEADGLQQLLQKMLAQPHLCKCNLLATAPAPIPADITPPDLLNRNIDFAELRFFNADCSVPGHVLTGTAAASAGAKLRVRRLRLSGFRPTPTLRQLMATLHVELETNTPAPALLNSRKLTLLVDAQEPVPPSTDWALSGCRFAP